MRPGGSHAVLGRTTCVILDNPRSEMTTLLRCGDRSVAPTDMVVA